jgi:hypothetical protein
VTACKVMESIPYVAVTYGPSKPLCPVHATGKLFVSQVEMVVW